MVGIATTVQGIVCATPLEAEVRELRLIAEHKPRYNRRSRLPERAVFVKLTKERYPRLSIVRAVTADGAAYLGPFSSPRTAELAVAAAHEAFRLRQCTVRITVSSTQAPCVLHEMGRCGAPCARLEDEAAYSFHATAYAAAVDGSSSAVVDAMQRRMARLTDAHRFEDAALQRDRLASFVRAAARTQRYTALAAVPELVAARRGERGGWEIAVVRHGRLAGAGASPPGEHPSPHIDALLATAEVVEPGLGPTPRASGEEMAAILRWLDRPGVRLVSLDGEWSSPATGAARHLRWIDDATAGVARVAPFADRRGLRPQHQPAR